jgi:hypothetical protein
MSGNSKRYNTRASNNACDLSYSAEDTLNQVKDGVSKICSLNEGTQKKITELVGYLDTAPNEVGLATVSSLLCTVIHSSVHKGYQK